MIIQYHLTTSILFLTYKSRTFLLRQLKFILKSIIDECRILIYFCYNNQAVHGFEQIEQTIP